MINLYKISFIFLALLSFHGGSAQISTLVGGIANVGDGGQAINANLQAFAMAADGSGNLYFVDNAGNSIRKLTVATGIITRVAGIGTQGFSGDNGLAINAQLNYPTGVAIDANNDILIADGSNGRIRKVAIATGIITTIAGNGTSGTAGDNGLAINAQFIYPFNIVLDSFGNFYVTDLSAHKIRKINSTTGIITTVAGNGNFGTDGDNGLAINAQLANPWGTAVDAAGNLYISTLSDTRIRKVNVSTGIISTIAGVINGGGSNSDNILAINARVSPLGITIDATGNLYIADQGNRVRKINNSTGIITTIAGSGTTRGFSGDGGPAAVAQTNSPYAVAIDNNGNAYFSDFENYRVRKVAAGTINTIAGNGIYGFNGDNLPGISTQLLSPSGITFDKSDNLYIADGSGSGKIRKVTKSTGIVTTIPTSASIFYPRHLAFQGQNNLYVASSVRIIKIDTSTGQESAIGGTGSTCNFNGDNILATTALIGPNGLAFDRSGNIYFSDYCLNRVRRIDAITNIVTTVAGNGNAASSGDNGPASSAEVNNPSFLAFDALDRLYFIENQTKVRRVDFNSGVITTFASGFSFASSLAIDSDFNLYVSDGAVIKKVDQAGVTTTVAGTGVYGYNGENLNPLNAQLGYMTGMAIDNARNLIVSENNGRIRKISNLLSLEPPVASAATNISASGFAANWNAATGATGYQLDVSKDNFATFVTGYNSKSVVGTSEAITGLVANTTYKYRVRAANGPNISLSSNVISATLKQNQTITFPALTNKVIGDVPFALTASASSGLSVSYQSSNASVATISGSTATIVGAGTTNIIASQPGNAAFVAATDVQQVLTVNKAAQTITFNALSDKTVGDAAFSISATAASGLDVTFSTTSSDRVTLSGTQVTIVNAGRATISANQSGNAAFNAAPSVNRSFCIKAAKPAIIVTGVNTATPTLTSSATVGNQWFLNGNAISGATNFTLNATVTGVYKVNVKVDDCTSDFSADVSLIVTGDLPANTSFVSAYPNPVEDYLQIQGISNIEEFRLMDVTGKERKIRLEKNSDEYSINVQDLPSGMYILHLNSVEAVHQLKFVKK